MEPTDGALLAAVAASASDTDFQQLVQRHGPMVINVCCRKLADRHDAEDAAQAVFLVLWNKASTLRKRRSVAGWLHRVADHVSRRAQRARAVRQRHEQKAATMNSYVEGVEDKSAVWDDIRDMIDRELAGLPEKYRLPLILFHLEGRSLEETAELLGLASSTVGTRLSRGRERLRTKLVRRGVKLSLVGLLSLLAAHACQASLPTTFAATTTQAATLFAAGKLAASGMISGKIAALSQGALNMLAIAKLKTATALFIVGVVVLGSSVAIIHHLASNQSANAAEAGNSTRSSDSDPAKSWHVNLQYVDYTAQVLGELDVRRGPSARVNTTGDHKVEVTIDASEAQELAKRISRNKLLTTKITEPPPIKEGKPCWILRLSNEQRTRYAAWGTGAEANEHLSELRTVLADLKAFRDRELPSLSMLLQVDDEKAADNRTKSLAVGVQAVAFAAAQPVAPFGFERHSANGNFMVKVTAPSVGRNADDTKKAKSTITVSAKQEDSWQMKWTVEAVNPIEPADAIVSDDGLSVVTIGNWHGTRVNKDELVVYREGRVLKRHGLEVLLAGHSNPHLNIQTCGGGWWGDSFSFIDDAQRFCFWIDIANKWIVVDLATGILSSPDGETERQCEEQARKDAYANIARRKGNTCHAYYRRLARFLRADDKALFQKLLMHPGQIASGSTETTSGEYSYWNSNTERELAEQVLLTFERGKTDVVEAFRNTSFDRHHDFRHLGHVSISADFDKAPKVGEGVVVLWLEDATTPNKRPKHARPMDAIGIDLRYQFPHRLKAAKKPLETPVTMYFLGVAPGKYRIHGYWARDVHYVFPTKEPYWNRTGEFAISQSPEVEIRPGKTVDVDVSFQMSASDSD